MTWSPSAQASSEDEGGRSKAASVAYRVAGEAIRLAHAACVNIPLNAGETRVVDAVIDMTATYSKLEDHVTLEMLARRAGMSKRNLYRAMDRPVELGVITYTPGRGRGALSRVGLPDPSGQKVTASGTVLNDKTGDIPDGSGAMTRRNDDAGEPEEVTAGGTPPRRNLETLETPPSDARRPASDGNGGGQGPCDVSMGQRPRCLGAVLNAMAVAGYPDALAEHIGKRTPEGRRLFAVLADREARGWDPIALADELTVDLPRRIHSVMGLLLARAENNVPREPPADPLDFPVLVDRDRPNGRLFFDAGPAAAAPAPVLCGRCHGDRRLEEDDDHGRLIVVPCPDCRGTGRVGTVLA